MDTVKGIILRSTDYKEKDKLLNIFTANGLITATAKGVRNPKAKLRASVMPMTFGEFVFNKKSKNRIISGIETIDNFYESWQNLNKMKAMSFCMEVCEKSFTAQEDMTDEFVCLLKTLKEINYGETNSIAICLKYLVSCATACGVDYSVISGYDADSYEILSSFGRCEADEIGTLPYSVGRVITAISQLYNVYKDFLGIKLNTFGQLIRY